MGRGVRGCRAHLHKRQASPAPDAFRGRLDPSKACNTPVCVPGRRRGCPAQAVEPRSSHGVDFSRNASKAGSTGSLRRDKSWSNVSAGRRIGSRWSDMRTPGQICLSRPEMASIGLSFGPMSSTLPHAEAFPCRHDGETGPAKSVHARPLPSFSRETVLRPIECLQHSALRAAVVRRPECCRFRRARGGIWRARAPAAQAWC